jgi:hypothetical protein
MIRLESGGSDCTMEAGFRENSVYSAYTQAERVSGVHGELIVKPLREAGSAAR